MRSISETGTPINIPYLLSLYFVRKFIRNIWQPFLCSDAGSCLKPGFESRSEQIFVFLCIFTSPCLGEYVKLSKLLVVGKLSADPHWNSVRDKAPNLSYYGERVLNGTLQLEWTNQQVDVNSIDSIFLLTITVYLHMFDKIKILFSNNNISFLIWIFLQ